MSLLAQIGRPYIPGWEDLSPFIAECWLIVTIVAVLLAPFFKRKSNTLCALVALAGLAMALVSLLWVGVVPLKGQAPLKGILIADHYALIWKAMLLTFTIGVVLMWFSTTASSMHEGDGPEFFTLLLGATLGMSMMASTTNLLMLVMAVEMASLPSYVMAGFRKTHRLGAEASLKYVLFGAVASSLMIYGLSFLYGMFGSLDIGRIAQGVAAGTGSSALLTIAIFGLIVGIGFKVSAVPFHFWCPDVFEGASIEVTTFLSVASKGAALALLLRVLMVIADALGYQDAQPLNSIAIAVGVIGAITATVGNTGAFVQNNIKRLLAYSSIAHAGYMLCVVSLLFNHNARLTSDQGINGPAQALLFYLAVYLFMNLGAFTVAGLVWRQTGSEDLSAFSGLVKRSPLLAHCMFACLISLIGLPPFGGFMAKLNVIVALIDNGGWWWWLVGVIGVNTIISAFFYFRVIKAMYLQDAGADQPAFMPNPLGAAVSLICAVALLLLLVMSNPISNATRQYSRLRGVEGKARITPAAPAAAAATSLPPVTLVPGSR